MLVKTQRIYVGVVKHTLYLSIFWKETHCKKIPSQRYHQLSLLSIRSFSQKDRSCYLLMNLCNAECIYRKNKQDGISLLHQRPQLPRDGWSLEASSFHQGNFLQIRNKKQIHPWLPIPTLVGLSRFISTGTSGSLLPPRIKGSASTGNEKWAWLHREQTKERGWAHPLLYPLLGLRVASRGDRGQHTACSLQPLGPSPCPLSTHI